MAGDTKELQRFVEHANKTLDSARTPDDFYQSIKSLVEDVGFSDFDYSHVADKHDVSFMANSLPTTLIDSYIEASLNQHDIALEYILNNEIPIYQSILDDYIIHPSFGLRRNHKNLSIRRLINSYGYYDAYIMPLKTNHMAGKVAFSIMSKNMKITDFRLNIEQSKAKLHRLGLCIHRLASKKFPKLFPGHKDNRVLTPRQIQVLEVMAKYVKTNQQAADRLNISVRTVNKHIEEAKESLGALSTANAIYLAIEKKLIPVGD